MKKYLRVSDLRDFEMMLNKGEVTYSKAVEMLNEKMNYKVNADRQIDFNKIVDSSFLVIKILVDQVKGLRSEIERLKDPNHKEFESGAMVDLSLKSNSNINDNPIAMNLEELHRKFNESFRDLKLPSRIKKSDKYDGTLPSLTSMVFEQMKPHLSVHVTPEETTYAFNPNTCPVEVMRDISSGLYKDYLNYHQMDISIKPPR